MVQFAASTLRCCLFSASANHSSSSFLRCSELLIFLDEPVFFTKHIRRKQGCNRCLDVHSLVHLLVSTVQFTVSRFLRCSSSFRLSEQEPFCTRLFPIYLSSSLSLSLLRPLPVYRHVFWLVQEHRERGRRPFRGRPRPAADFPGRRSDHASSVPFR